MFRQQMVLRNRYEFTQRSPFLSPTTISALWQVDLMISLATGTYGLIDGPSPRNPGHHVDFNWIVRIYGRLLPTSVQF